MKLTDLMYWYRRNQKIEDMEKKVIVNEIKKVTSGKNMVMNKKDIKKLLNTYKNMKLVNRTKKNTINLIDLNGPCSLKCNCGWNLQIGGLNKQNYKQILLYLNKNFEIKDMVNYENKIETKNPFLSSSTKSIKQNN